MANLGTLGHHHLPVEDTFDWFGTTIRANSEVTDTTIVDWMERAQKIDEESPEAIVLVKDLIRSAIHPDDFDTYWQIGRTHRQTIQDHMAVAQALVSAVAGRPSVPSSASSAGLEPSGEGSTAPSSPPATADPAVALVRRVTAGRPDIELGLVQDITSRRTG